MRPPRRALAAALVLLCVACIGWLTLTPRSTRTAHDPAWCLACAHLSARDIILNIFLFVPLGAALAMSGLRTRWCILLTLAGSLAIESVQWVAIAGRQASLMDVLTNTTGGAIGALLVHRRAAWVRPSVPVARGLAALVALAWVVQLAVTSWALRIDLRPAARYWGQWAHVFRTTERFPGSVQAFGINGTPLPDDTVVGHERLREAMLRDGVTITASATEGAEVPTRAQIVGLADDSGNLLVGITQERCANRLIGRMRGDAYGLASPGLRLERPCRPGEATEFAGSITRQAITLSATRSGAVESARLELRPTIGWMLLAPWSRLLRQGVAITFAWVLCFGLALGWMLGGSHIGAPAAAGISLLALPGAAMLASRLSGLAAPGLAEWIAFGLSGALAYAWAARNAASRVAR
jgi:hypothetical protein